MKSRFIREILLLSLPIIALGGVFWLKNHNGGLALSKFESPFDTGPVRLECTPLAPVDATPWQVSRGYTFNAVFEVKMKGRQPVPNTWTVADLQGSRGTTAQVFYRKGNVWSLAPNALMDGTPSSNQIEISANLSEIPKDADEIRLRGHMTGEKFYVGPTPKGWVAPRNFRNATWMPGKVYHVFSYNSKPFNILIKAPGKPFPSPVVDRRPRIEILDATLHDWKPSDADIWVEMKVRHLDKLKQDDKNWGVMATDPILFDANGKEVILFDKKRKVVTLSSSNLSYPGYGIEDSGGPGLRTIGFTTRDVAPSRGWNSVKRPMTLKVTLTDSNCWPTIARIKLRSN